MSYHSCSGKDPQLSKGPPTARCSDVANPPFTQCTALSLFQSREKKRVTNPVIGWSKERESASLREFFLSSSVVERSAVN